MKITLLEPLGIPEEVLARYQSRLEKRGHQFTAYGEKTTDPAELIRRTGESHSCQQPLSCGSGGGCAKP